MKTIVMFVIVVGVALAIGANVPQLGIQFVVQAESATQITVIDGSLMRLNTTTGAMYRFRGSLDNASVKNTWFLRVNPVTSSGMLEIQYVANTTFLVDVQTGMTWILRQRGNHNATWDAIKVFPGA